MIKNLSLCILIALNIGVSELFEKRLKLRETQGLNKIKDTRVYTKVEKSPYTEVLGDKVSDEKSRAQFHLTKLIIDNN